MVEMELTFQKICELEPELERLYSSVRANALGGNQDYLWENIWKPRIDQLVGPNCPNRLLRNEAANRIVTDKIWKTLGISPGT